MTIRGAVLDVDGTVLRGDERIDGAAEGLETLARRGVDRLFVSNNPTKAPPAYAERFARAGFDIDPDEILTAGSVTVEYLLDTHAEDAVYLFGEEGLAVQCHEAGLDVVEDTAAADVGVVSIDRSFDYDDLTEALRLFGDDDVAFVGSDPDIVIPAAEGNVPGSGAMIQAVAAVAERDPDAVLGKPSETCQRLVRERLDYPPSEVLVVGDRLDTDVALGARAGMVTALVRTGVTDGKTLAESDVEPDYVLDSLGDVARVLDVEA